MIGIINCTLVIIHVMVSLYLCCDLMDRQK